MKKALTLLTGTCLLSMLCPAQRIQQVPDSIRKKYKVRQLEEKAEETAKIKEGKKNVIDFTKYDNDSLLTLKLIELALAYNPEIAVSDVNTNVSEAELRYAKKSWLNAISANGNVNEFVVNNSAASSFFPKYNFGVSVPFDIFSRVKKDKAIARGNIEVNKYNKQTKINMVKEEVQLKYEAYKEMKEVMMLQQESLEYDLTANEAAKKSYADGEITLEEMNKAYQVVLQEKSKLVSKRRNYHAAKISLQEYIGYEIIDTE